MSAVDALHALVARLRAPDGCPWDRAQTEASLRPFLLEEVHEVIDAIDNGDDRGLKKELGDLVFLVMLLARMAEERGAFTFNDAMQAAHDKMVHRHPHVFGDAPNPDEPDVARWEALKAQERPASASSLDGVPPSLPALILATRLTEKAAAVGFDWPDAKGPRDKIDEELAELDQAIAEGDVDHISHELGDVLFSVVNLARHLPGDGAEDALRQTTRRFARRFRGVEDRARSAGVALHETPMPTLEAWWQDAKREENA